MEQRHRVCIDFYASYQPAMVERFGNSSASLMEEFNKELGLEIFTHYELPDEEITEFVIVDPKLFMLAQIKYGF